MKVVEVMKLGMLQVPKAKLTAFAKKGIETVEDLLNFVPRDYYDLRFPVNCRFLVHDKMSCTVGLVEQIRVEKNYARIRCRDRERNVFHVTFFGNVYLARKARKGDVYFVGGKVKIDQYGVSFTNPVVFSQDIEGNQRINPVYSKIKGIPEDYLKDLIRQAFVLSKDEPDFLDEPIRQQYHLMTRMEAYKELHYPTCDTRIAQAKNRLNFDDLFLYTVELKRKELASKADSPYRFTKSHWMQRLIRELPFDITSDQLNAVTGGYLRIQQGQRLEALVQGDVGSGKTIVAMMYALLAAENGYQTALIAPTTVLAKQHYLEFKERLAGFDLKVAYLSSEMKAKERKKVLFGLLDGSIDIVIGTHSIISKDVSFKNLALTICDEEHRFGVKQREALYAKGYDGVHKVSMSATPIPRTLALTMYGNATTVFTIKTMPKGRKPVQTFAHTNEIKVFEAIERQVKQGRQAYIVCPLIEESDKLDIQSVEETLESALAYFEPRGIKVRAISGKMKQDEIEDEIAGFVNNDFDVLISTTIVEVGVNVPNASVMYIKHADRFGLAQLHQLRGRVGRGQYEGYCVLQADSLDNPKIQAMLNTTNGFEIAKADLKIRGTGSLLGHKQSGHNAILSKVLAYPELYEQIRKSVDNMVLDEARWSKCLEILECKKTVLSEKEVG